MHITTSAIPRVLQKLLKFIEFAKCSGLFIVLYFEVSLLELCSLANQCPESTRSIARVRVMFTDFLQQGRGHTLGDFEELSVKAQSKSCGLG